MKKIYGIIKIAGLAAFAAVLIYSWNQPVFNVGGYMDDNLEEAAYEQIGKKPDLFAVSGGKEAYFGFSGYIGYAGPLTVATSVGEDGKIISVKVVAHKETPVYMGKLVNKHFFDQFKGKDVGSAFHLDSDIDAVSGATISSRAVAESVRAVSHSLAKNNFRVPYKVTREKVVFGAAEVVVIGYFLLVILFALIVKKPKYRAGMLLVSIAVIGVWLNRALSVSQISGAFQGYFPLVQENILWYVMVFGSLLLVLISGKNLYCSWICPFGGVQEYTNKATGGVKMHFRGNTAKAVKVLRELFMFCLLGLSFVMINPSVATVEPFGTLFGLNGLLFSWAVCFIGIIGSLFSLRFWCNTLCPVGAFLDILSRAKGLVFRGKTVPVGPKKAAAAAKSDPFVLVCYVLLGVCVLVVLFNGIKEALLY